MNLDGRKNIMPKSMDRSGFVFLRSDFEGARLTWPNEQEVPYI